MPSPSLNLGARGIDSLALMPRSLVLPRQASDHVDHLGKVDDLGYLGNLPKAIKIAKKTPRVTSLRPGPEPLLSHFSRCDTSFFLSPVEGAHRDADFSGRLFNFGSSL